jgi:hypothetical protein
MKGKHRQVSSSLSIMWPPFYRALYVVPLGQQLIARSSSGGAQTELPLYGGQDFGLSPPDQDF